MLTVTYVLCGGPANGQLLAALVPRALPETVTVDWLDWTPWHTEGEAVEVKRIPYRVIYACRRWNGAIAFCVTEQDFQQRTRTWTHPLHGVEDWLTREVREFDALYGGPQVFDEERSLRVGTPKERD